MLEQEVKVKSKVRGGRLLFIMEFITDITATIDEADYKDSVKLRKILEPYCYKKKGSCYSVRGNFEEVEQLSEKLLAVEHNFSPATHGLITHQQSKNVTAHIRSVEVSAAVMYYIQQICAKELSKIQGNRFIIEAQPQHNNPNSTVQVTVRPHHVCNTNSVHTDFVRQRFITFYQRTASNLQVASLSVSRRAQKDLQERFPQLLFKPSHKDEVTVTGPFVCIAKLKEFILLNNTGSSKSTASEDPTNSPRGRKFCPQSTHSKGPEDESCPICMETINITEKETLQCKHSFCRDCLKRAFHNKPVCPTCGKVYGALTGTQPEGGKMTVTTKSSFLPGYEQYGTIIIQYHIPGGIQKEERPNCGLPYDGASRTAYLPDSSEGRRILELLRRAFDQRLIFTVGRSTTSGRNNTVTWNDIHHKTSTRGGPTHYGYPDPDYLSRVADELRAKGIE